MVLSPQSFISPLSAEVLEHSDQFVELVKTVRSVNPTADEFFREFFEFCQDFEQFSLSQLPSDQQYWLIRLGRMLALLGHDPFPNLTFTHPEGKGYAD